MIRATSTEKRLSQGPFLPSSIFFEEVCCLLCVVCTHSKSEVQQ
jgi:hypothetical protein